MKPLLVQVVPVSLCHVLVSSESLCLVWSCPLSTGILWWVSSLRHLFCREKRPNSFRLPSQGRFSSPGIIFVFFLWTFQFFCVFPEQWGQHWARGSGPASQRLIRVGQWCLHLCKRCPCRGSPGSRVPLLLQQCPADPASLSTRTPDPFQQGCFPAMQIQVLLSSLVALAQVMWWYVYIVKIWCSSGRHNMFFTTACIFTSL